jgi:proteasome lid subunit RPN8/RPN11
MNAVIKIHEIIYDEIIKHANYNPTKECGGYLFGYCNKNDYKIELLVTDIYYERIIGKEASFFFGLVYGNKAINYMHSQNNLGRPIKLIGCYHSHGIYPALFSEADRILEKAWSGNRAVIIYSPSDKQMIGDIISDTGIIIPARVTTYNNEKAYQKIKK